MNLQQCQQMFIPFASLAESRIAVFFIFSLFIYKNLPKKIFFPVAFPVIQYSPWQLGKSRLKPCPVIK